MESDKELLRQGRYSEALGDNYYIEPIYVMLFNGNEFVDQLPERFENKYKALDWLKANKPLLTGDYNWRFGNINHDWL